MTIHTAITRLTDPALMRQQALIGGAWVDADSGAKVEVTDPATGAVLGTVPDISAGQTRAAIAAADTAFAGWRKRTSVERADHLMAWHDLTATAPDPRILILTLEQAKRLAKSRGAIPCRTIFVRWFAKEVYRFDGQAIAAPGAGRRILTNMEPVGSRPYSRPRTVPMLGSHASVMTCS